MVQLQVLSASVCNGLNRVPGRQSREGVGRFSQESVAGKLAKNEKGDGLTEKKKKKGAVNQPSYSTLPVI